MKATSIEQIREHLARGGTVTVNSPQWLTHRVVERVAGETSKGPSGSVVWFTTGGAIYFDKRFDWELLPIEEEKLGKRISLSEAREIACKTMQDAEARRTIEPFSGRTPMGVVDELRRKLMFGHPWSMEEQRQVWELLTGERIEWGRRCEKCECSGRIPETRQSWAGTRDCPKCNGSGYTVRPTWMGEVKR